METAKIAGAKRALHPKLLAGAGRWRVPQGSCIRMAKNQPGAWLGRELTSTWQNSLAGSLNLPWSDAWPRAMGR